MTNKKTTKNKKAAEAHAKAKVAKLREMERDHRTSQMGRKYVLFISLLLNIFFLTAIYAILINKQG